MLAVDNRGQLDVGDGCYPGQVRPVALDGLGPDVTGPSLAFDPGCQVLAQGRFRPADTSNALAACGLQRLDLGGAG